MNSESSWRKKRREGSGGKIYHVNNNNNNYLLSFFKAECRRPDASRNSAFVMPVFFREMSAALTQQHENINNRSSIFNPYAVEFKLKEGLEICY